MYRKRNSTLSTKISIYWYAQCWLPHWVRFQRDLSCVVKLKELHCAKERGVLLYSSLLITSCTCNFFRHRRNCSKALIFSLPVTKQIHRLNGPREWQPSEMRGESLSVLVFHALMFLSSEVHLNSGIYEWLTNYSSYLLSRSKYYSKGKKK